MGYASFVLRRLAHAVPVVLGVTLVVFLLIHLVPGDPARTALGTRATPDAVAQLRAEWGLDGSLVSQYGSFMERLVRGDLGQSLTFQRPTRDLIAERLPVTLWLVGYAAVLACLMAVPLALLAVSRPDGARDRFVRLFSVVALALPAFWLGLLLIQLFGVKLQLLPTAGFGEGFLGHVEHMFLPALTIAIGVLPLMVRSLRAEMLTVSGSDYVVTARAKGLSERRVRVRHVLRNALVPSVTILAINVGFLIGGTMLVERIFSLAGIGDLMLQGIDRRDFAVVQSVALVLAIAVILVNILTDMVHAWLDPRVEAR